MTRAKRLEQSTAFLLAHIASRPSCPWRVEKKSLVETVSGPRSSAEFELQGWRF